MTLTWIAEFPPLARLNAETCDRLTAGSSIIELPAGSRIFGPGQSPEHFLLLLEGTVRVSQVSESGREIVLYRVSAGESCALTTACLMGYEDYQAEGVAETKIRGVAISRLVFDELIASSREFRAFVFTAFSRRVTHLFSVIEQVAFSRFEVRLVERLLQLADHQGRVTATHQDLANELGSAREVVSRQLTELQRRGLIRVQRGAVDLVDVTTLEHIARHT